MKAFPIGVLLESFQTDTHTALKKAAELNLGGIQIYATRGKFAPRAMTPEKCREFLKLVQSTGSLLPRSAATWVGASGIHP